MKSLAELKELRDKAKSAIGDGDSGNTRVVVGLATCGIAAGARPVMSAIADEVAKENLKGITVKQTGCIGICQYEPVVEIIEYGKPKTTYVKMTAEKAIEVVRRHLMKGEIIEEYTVGYNQA